MPSPKLYSVNFTKTAISDLDKVYSYIARTREDAVIARRLIDGIKNCICSLNQYPRGGNIFPNQPNVYTIHYKKYVIIYYVHEPTKQVVILRILRSSYASQFGAITF